jgi:hypothetical protein
MKLVIVRFARPRAGSAAANIDQDALRTDLQAQLERLVQARLGEDTELRLELAATSEIRLEGRFAVKPLEVKAIVSEALGEVMDGFDFSGYAL